jgi:hypothetical protein
MNFKKYVALAACLAALTGCFGAKNASDLSSYQEDFRENNVNVFLKSFSDHRQGLALIVPEGSGVLYAYKPQVLANGQMLPLLGYYLYHAADLEDTYAEKSVGVDVSIRDMKTLIRSGNFASGKLGYYSAEVQARVILRDMKKNEIITTFPIVISKNQARTTTNGRVPTAKEDNYALLQLVDEVALKLADEVLDEVAEITNEYYVEDKSALFEYSETAVTETAISPLDKLQDVKVEQVEEEELKVTPDLLDKIADDERKLIEKKEEQRRDFEQELEDRKEAERALFDKKIEDQKYLDFLDSKQ